MTDPIKLAEQLATALAVIEQFRAVLPGVLDDAESNLNRVHDEWGFGALPDDDEELLAIKATRAILNGDKRD